MGMNITLESLAECGIQCDVRFSASGARPDSTAVICYGLIT